jgi:hypothetical protein
MGQFCDDGQVRVMQRGSHYKLRAQPGWEAVIYILAGVLPHCMCWPDAVVQTPVALLSVFICLLACPVQMSTCWSGSLHVVFAPRKFSPLGPTDRL